MKLILNSKGLNTMAGADQIRKAIGKTDLESKKIFIVSFPYYEVDEIILKNCLLLGFREENIFFAKDGLPDVKISYVYVSEGNTFEILDYMRKLNIMAFIKESCEAGAIYIGSSAGALIAGTDIRLALDFDSNYVGLRDYSALGLFDGTILPHYTKEQAERYKEASDYEVISSYRHFYSVDNDNYLCIEV